MNNLLIIFSVMIITVIANELIFYDIGVDDISSSSSVGVTTVYNTSTNNLIIDALVRNRGCSETPTSYALYYIDNNIITTLNATWSSIRYTTEFYGYATCWSILGNTARGLIDGNITNTGLYPFNINIDTLISNELLYNLPWTYQLTRCDGNVDGNFWRGSGDYYKGKIRVEQRRDLSSNMAGISFGASCTSPNVTRIRFTDIQVGYEMPTPFPTMEPTMEPTLEPIIGDEFEEDEENLFGNIEHIGIGAGFGCLFVLCTYLVVLMMRKKEPTNPKIQGKHKVNANSTNIEDV